MQLHFTKRLMEIHAESRVGPTGCVLLLSHIPWLCLLVFSSYWLWGTALELSVFKTWDRNPDFNFSLYPQLQRALSQPYPLPAHFAVFRMRRRMLPSNLPYRNALRTSEITCKMLLEHREWHQLFFLLISWGVIYYCIMWCNFRCSVTIYKKLFCWVVVYFSGRE